MNSSRRDVLKGLSAGASALLTGAGLTGSAGATASEKSEMLGDFRDGRDGWRSRGPNRENRIGAGQTSVITTGDHGLQVPFTESRFASIRNQRRVRDADFSDYRHLFARLTSSVAGTNSPLVFFARLHYTGPRNGKNQGNGTSQGDGRSTEAGGKPVIESHPIVVPQNTTHSLYWDLANVQDRIRRNARRLEIVWFLSDHPPADNGQERGRGHAEYNGTVLFDHLRLSDDEADVARKALEDKRQDLRRFHGTVVDNEILRRTDDMELGNLIYSDGEKVMYGVKYHGEGSSEDDDRDVTYILGGERFALGGDQ